MQPVILISTRTIDRMPADSNGRVVQMPGGPAHYTGMALRQLGCEYTLITGAEARVDVLRTEFGEQYVIPRIDRIPLPASLCGSAIILSPIIGEIDVNSLPEMTGPVIVDLQGFVRKPMEPTDEVHDHFRLAPLLQRAHAVKGTESELSRLDEESHQALRDTVLVLTYGRRGCSVVRNGKRTFVPAHPVRVGHSIGAGDTFLAAFAVGTVRGDSPEQAAEFAARFTEQVLMERASRS